MAKWKRSGADALREYEQSSNYVGSIGVTPLNERSTSETGGQWKRSGADALREYEQSSSFPQTIQVRKYNAEDRNYDQFADEKYSAQVNAQRRATNRYYQEQVNAAAQAFDNYRRYSSSGAAKNAAHQNYEDAKYRQELARQQMSGKRLTPAEQKRLTTIAYRDPAQAAAQEAAENTPAAKNREWADERTKKRQEQLSEQEFNRSGAMQERYGSYDNYLRGVYAGYDEAVAKREAEQAKTSEDLQAESDALQTRLDALSDQLKTAYQNPSAENYKNLMELQQQWKDVRTQKKEADQRVNEKQRGEKRSAKQAAQEAAQEKYDGWSEERMQGRLDELNRQINLALARSDGTADVSALKTEREALEGEKRRVYPTAWQKAGRFLDDAGTAFYEGGNAQAMSGLEMAHNVAETKVNQGAAWALRDIANSATLHALGGDRYAEKLRSLADRLATEYDYTDAQAWQDEYNRIMSEVSQDHSPAGTWILQQLPSAGAMAVDLMVSTATGGAISPMTAMGIRAGGNAMLDAHNEGATDTQAVIIGLQNAAVEMLSEKLFGGNPVYDEDVGLVNKAVSKLTKSKTVMKVLDSKAFDFVSEGAEEAIAELLEPTFQSLVLKGTLKGATNAENIGNAFLGGVFLAALGNLAGLPGGLTQAKQERQTKYYAKILAEQGAQSENAGVREAAAIVQEKLDYGRTPDMEDIGRVLSAMDDAGETQAAQAAVDAASAPSGGQNAAPTETVAPRQNAAQTPAQDAQESTIMNTDPAEHTKAEQDVIDAYQDAVDDGLVRFVEQAIRNKGSNNSRYTLKPVSDRAAADIQEKTGVNVSGFKTVLEQRAAEHIVSRHGANGSADTSMRDMNDIGRIQYVLDNYDSLENGGKAKSYTTVKENGKPGTADSVVYRKKVNGTYYVVEAVPNTKAKTTFIVSAYMNKDGVRHLVPGQSGPNVNARSVDAEAPSSFDSSVAERSSTVKQADASTLSSMAQTLGKSGQKAIFKAYDGKTDTAEYAGEFVKVYNAARAGNDLPETKTLEPWQRYAAETAGKNDMGSTPKTAQEAAKTPFKPGLDYSDYVKAAVRDGEMTTETAQRIDTVAKQLGVRVRFADEVAGGTANAEITGNEVLIEKHNSNPVMFLLGHELTHRIQETAPEQYQQFREAIMDEIRPQAQAVMENYAQRGYEITEEAALDEAAADYAGRMIDDGEVLNDFIEKHRGDRTLLQKIIDAIRSFIRKLTGAERKKAETAEGKLLAAMDAAAENTKNAAGDGSTQFSIKETENGKKYVLIDQQQGRFIGLNNREAEKLALEIIQEEFSGQTIPLGEYAAVTIRRQENWKAHRSGDRYDGARKYVHDGTYYENSAFQAKMRAAANLDEMLEAAEYVGHSEDHKNHTFATDGFDYYKTTFVVGGRAFEGTFNIGLSDMGATFYGMTKITQVTNYGTLASALVTDAQPNHGDLRKSKVTRNGENVNRKFSLKEVSAEERKQHDNDALSYFGKTYKWSETGYVLLDGSKLDFSGRHEGGPGGYRTVDHRDIVDALGEDYGGGDYSGGMVQFMQEGNIRISPESGGINIAVMPTKAQMDSLSDFISKERGAVILDIDDANGDTLSSTEYPRGTHANRVLQDIRNYFNEGVMPEVSSTPTVSQFRYSVKGAEVSREYADVLKENELLKERVDYWKGQTKRTVRTTTNEKSVGREANSLVKRYGADLDAADIQSNLQSLYDAMANGELDGKEAFAQAREIAGKLVENAVEANDELYQSYKDLRDFLRTTKLTISEEDGKNIPDLAELRKQNFGRMTIGKGQTNIDQVYQELADQWPEFFDEDAVSHPADQLQQIADVLGKIYTITEQNPYQGYMEQAKTAAANEILDDFFELPQTRKTFADRQAAALSEAKAKGKAQAQKVREQKNAQLADLREKNRERVNSILEKERTRRADQINKLKEQYKSRDTAAKERRETRELRNKIIRHTKGLSQKLIRPTDKQHIPEILKHEVAAMLESINLESQYTIAADGKRVKDGSGTPTKRSEAFAALKAKYTQIVKDGDAMTVDPYLLGNTAEGIEGGFDEVIKMKDTPLADLSKSQLQTVWNVVRAVEHSVSTYGKMLSNAKYTQTRTWAEAIRNNVSERRPIRKRTTRLTLDLETPYTFFSHYGDSGKAIYRMLRDAQDQQQLIVDRVTEETQKIVDPKTVKELEKQTHTFQTESGKALTLTTAQAMEIYNLMQRKQALEHLTEGGIIQPEIKSAKIGRGFEAIRLTEADLQQIAGSLTPEQVKIADGLQGMTTGLLADYGNDASMRAYGYKKFTEKNYWPIRSAREGVQSTVEKGGNQPRSIQNIGLAKPLTPGANNPLDIPGIFTTFANHAAEMTDYAAWLCAMEDANHLFNYQFRDENGLPTGRNIRQILDEYGGRGAQSYWRSLMDNIQNGINLKEFGPISDFAGKAIGGFKGAAVGGNIRVVIQQPTAFFRAAAVLDPADMAKGLVKGVKGQGGWSRALEYSPIAMRKDSGSFDISAPYTMKETLFDTRTAVRKLNDTLSAPAGAADALTWGRLWNACEWTVHRENPYLEPGSKAFYEQTAKQFAEVIDQTQVVDGVLQRSNIMRNRGEIAKQATSFMGEPIMSLNLLIRSWDNVRYENEPRKRGKAIKTFGRAVMALAVTGVVNALAQSLIDAIRDDDPDKDYKERYLTALTGISGDEETTWQKAWNAVMEGNLGGNLNYAGNIPYVKDIFSLLQGYEVNRMDTEVVGNLVDAGKMFVQNVDGKGTKTPAYAVKSLLGAVSKVYSVPVNNLTRDLWGMARSVAVETRNIPMQYEMEKAIYNITNVENKSRYISILYRALEQGDIDTFQHIRSDLMNTMGLDGAEIDESLRSKYNKAVKKDPAYTLPLAARDLIGSRDKYKEETTDEKFSAKDLSETQYRAYSDQRATDYREIEDALKDSDTYQSLDAKTRSKLIEAAYDLVEQQSLEDHSDGQYEITTKWMTLADDAEKIGIEPYMYVTFHVVCNTTESTKGTDGKTVKGQSKSDKIRKWLKGNKNLTEQQRKFLWESVYESDW